MFFLSVVFGFLFWFFNSRCRRKLCDLWRLFAFSEPEIVAVRTTVDVIRAGAAGDLQFLRQSGINNQWLWLLLGFKFCFFSSSNRAPKMKLFLPYILLFAFPTWSAGVDFQHVSQPAALSVFMKHPYSAEKAASIVKRSLPAWLSPAEPHRITRRSTEQGESCTALLGADTKLADNTHRVSYRPRSCYYSASSRLTIRRKSRCTEMPHQLVTLLRWCFSEEPLTLKSFNLAA